MSTIDYKCPGCGGGMVYNSEIGMLYCASCGREEKIEQFAAKYKLEQEHDSSLQQFHCNSCGAELITDQLSAATVCSFCGSGVIIGERLAGKWSPDLVIPFTISKEEAIDAFRKWCRNGRFTPKGFMSANRIKAITGMYVPFWLYDLDNDVEVKARATRIRTYIQGDYQYTETQHYALYRKLKLNYSQVPIDASEKMNDSLMDKLEPFPYEQLKSFQVPYLAGFVAEKYSYNEDEMLPRADEKVKSYIDAYIQSTLGGFTTVSVTDNDVRRSVKHAKYALLPVWVLHYDYNQLEYTFAMNGQTGKVVGKPPISKGKIALWFGVSTTATLLIIKSISAFMGGGFW
ncbi:TFIIB-type zinc ribbon-containing protein [Paenibacillus yanchengensis]|uniref:TFIIB-type zinc ribbon-containing protein n=1 Tax=Paenibacillus yanchengensis TaxID=2035833 RepID=A0ABW4YJG3_9BACL